MTTDLLETIDLLKWKVIFISGPYRSGNGEYHIRENIRRAEDAALQVWLLGAVALCPHKNTAFFGGAYALPDSVWLAGDIILLSKCYAIMMIDGW